MNVHGWCGCPYCPGHLHCCPSWAISWCHVCSKEYSRILVKPGTGSSGLRKRSGSWRERGNDLTPALLRAHEGSKWPGSLVADSCLRHSAMWLEATSAQKLPRRILIDGYAAECLLPMSINLMNASTTIGSNWEPLFFTNSDIASS